MKNLNINKIKNLDINKGVIFILTGLVIVLLIHLLAANNNIDKMWEELVLAKQPSEIEVKITDLQILEWNWRATENELNLKRERRKELKEALRLNEEKISTLQDTKFNIESLIHEKRSEIIWVK